MRQKLERQLKNIEREPERQKKVTEDEKVKVEAQENPERLFLNIFRL